MTKRLYLQLILLSLIWGASFFFFKILLKYAEPPLVAFWRCTFGAVAIIVISILMKKKWQWEKSTVLMLIVVGILNTALPWSLIAFSEQKLTSNLASVMNATTPLWTLLIGTSFFGTKAGGRQWLGIGIGFVGLLILLDINPITLVSINLTGFFGMLAATFCYGITSHLTKRYLNNLNIYQLASGTLLAGMAGSGVVSLFMGDFSASLILHLDSFLALIGIGVLGSGIANVLYFTLIQKGSAEFASLTTYLIPVTAIFWGSIFLNEKLSWSLFTGLGFILSGVFLAGKSRKSVEKSLSSRFQNGRG